MKILIVFVGISVAVFCIFEFPSTQTSDAKLRLRIKE